MKKIKLWKVKFLLLGQRQHERLKHEINRFYAQCCYIESVQLWDEKLKVWKIRVNRWLRMKPCFLDWFKKDVRRLKKKKRIFVKFCNSKMKRCPCLDLDHTRTIIIFIRWKKAKKIEKKKMKPLKSHLAFPAKSRVSKNDDAVLS